MSPAYAAAYTNGMGMGVSAAAAASLSAASMVSLCYRIMSVFVL